MVLTDKIKKVADELFATSKKIYDNPEIAFEEYRSVEQIEKLIKSHGLPFKKGIAGLKTAFMSQIGRGKPTIALLCEYDALPGIGHACGHNLISMMSVGAFLALKDMDLKGQVLLIGTPGEEGGGGKIKMIEKGIFSKVDAAMMIHPSNKTLPGKEFLAVDEFKLIFKGKSSHAAAAPEEGINALDACIQTFNNLNALRQHLTPDVRIHGVIMDGGLKPNIVPDHASAEFLVRCADQKAMPALIGKFRRCAESAASAFEAKIDIEHKMGYKAMKRNMAFEKVFSDNLTSLGIRFDQDTPLMGAGSSDIGDLSQIIPCIHPT
ncbi:amidohydrolase, partial [Candidatus Woesearchaeota archaeon CG11_big_fil_rev_8_21_14_0_20_43_8]